MTGNDTIAAIATPSGKGGVGIIRISGDRVKQIAVQILGILPAPRHATFCRFNNQKTVIDEGIALYFPAPHSFTGEDVLELQGHGGAIVLDLLLNTVLIQGARLAKPGEFSRRAFLNGKIDLSRAEAIADLINADSVQAAKCAVLSLQGEFSRKIYCFRDALIELRMFIEASIDFSEEEIDFLAKNNVQYRVEQLINEIKQTRATTRQGVLLQEGITVVIAGEPNVGKSSLLNRLSGEDTAIVTDIAGTTRDVLRQKIQLDGMPLHVADTAGLRETDDVVEQEGVRRARDAIKKSDLLLLVIDGSQHNNLNEAVYQTQTALGIPDDLPFAVIVNKIDLSAIKSGYEKIDQVDMIRISAKTGEGIDALCDFLKKFAGFNQQQEDVFIARRRHLDALERALDALYSGLKVLTAEQQADELLAEDLLVAQQALNEITGEFSSDDLLGEIFSGFCIGK